MSSKDHSTLLVSLRYLGNNLPHETASFRVHSCRRFIKQNDWGVTDGGNCYRQLALVSSTQSARWFSTMFIQIEFVQRLLNNLRSHIGWNSPQLCVEPQMFLTGKQVENCIMLGTVANQFTSLIELTLHVIALNCNLTSRRNNICCQTFECRRFTSTVDSEESEALAVIKSEINTFNS